MRPSPRSAVSAVSVFDPDLTDRPAVASQLDFACMNRLKACDCAQGCGLAAAGWAEQATDVTGIEVQVEILHNLVLVVTTAQVVQVEQQ